MTVIGLLDTGIITMTQGYPALGDLHDASVQIALAGPGHHGSPACLQGQGQLDSGHGRDGAAQPAVRTDGAAAAGDRRTQRHWSRLFKLDFTGLLRGDGLSGMAALAALLLSMTMVDLFDTLGFF